MCILLGMRHPFLAVVCLLAACILASGADSLFGKRMPASGQDTAPADTPMEEPAKQGGDGGTSSEETSDGQKSGSDRKRKGGGQKREGGGQKREGGGQKKDHAEEPPDEGGVRIRPIKLNEGIQSKDRTDFQISRIDKPLAKETGAAFREAWAAFRTQNQVGDNGFSRVTRPVVTVKARCLQDLGEGRWLVDAEWTNPGLGDWCPAGANADKAVLVLEPGAAKVGDALEVNAVHVGLIEVRFDCEVPPAQGRRITLRRHAFLGMAALPDDDATRARFQQVVAEGRNPPEALVVQVRDCKGCGGVGYLRRPVPGKIQDARDPCPEGCERGRQRVPVVVTFKP